MMCDLKQFKIMFFRCRVMEIEVVSRIGRSMASPGRIAGHVMAKAEPEWR